ncbi:type I restriction enzyme R subunit [Mariniflexile fucanivorans]|uniref:Type I restriction enzyme R subunit n=1 Tax=Mariniflexile fucanivorans TaxID=264023 RepID=A0A4R1RS46_9FLAO|nr:DEAD/DEAH box helicase family protein [Mariniflexile fucanivorans]TCL69291.1 type I restriction enzyme R subunit [Mariniflexile fucanivorans]
MASGTKEIHFEEHIENYLTNTVKEYHSISAALYDKDLCVIPNEIIAFVKDTQPKQYEALQKQYGTQVDTKIVENVAKNISKNKTLDVLRNGIKDRGEKLELAYFKPAHNKTPEHEVAYVKNRLAIVRQLKYSNRNNNSIDFVLFINGIPVVTAELKNALTGQNHHNAVKQYIQDREPKGEPFLEFKRCLVHFAVGTEKVLMATELKGRSTYFLPFNKGLVNENPNGFAVAYLWEDVWRKDSLMDLVQNFVSVQTDKEKIYNPATKKLEDKTSTKLLFPRFHQRRAVNRILEALKTDGTGKNYLVQHSAGSGKSNTITWLAYRLANFYQNYTDNKALYDSIIVVTDRRVLNKQIQDNIRQLDNTPGVVAYLDEKTTAQDLKQAIEEKKRIIITTIQKFPIISNVVTSFPDRKYAILIDEAHSSQSGEASRHMRKALSLEEAAEEEKDIKTIDEIIAEEISKKGQQPNISQFAFTATPKPKTLELFGTKVNGQITAFDEYTMEEAIREGFIKDVLKNYMSFKRYYKLVKRTEIDDKEYEKKKTVRVLGNYVDLQDHAIEKKARIIIEHFASQTQNEIQGQARAMLVTKSRLHAVRFKRKFDEIMQEMKLPYKALVAFSGTVKDEETGEDYTETSMNNLGGKIGIPEALKLPQNRILIVANKYQTGFDEPLLHTMFVDKKLGGANTVQTLSRLNRNRRGKDSTMILDFVNDPELVRADFQHFYGKNYMDEENETDPNSLYDVLNTIEGFNVYYDTEVEAFANVFFISKENMESIQPILNTISARFDHELEEEDKAAFKAAVQSFTKVYRFLSQIITFTDVELEKKYVFLAALLKKLPYTQSNLPLDVVNDIELDSYKIQHKFTTDLELESANGEDVGMKPGGPTQKPEDELDLLTKIIKVLNDTFGLELTEEDKVDFNRVKKNLYDNDELMAYFNKQNSKNNIKDKFDEVVDNEFLNFINTKLDFYNKMTDDKANAMFKTMLFNEFYNREVRGVRK